MLWLQVFERGVVPVQNCFSLMVIERSDSFLVGGGTA
jgi:hypothetical protein